MSNAADVGSTSGEYTHCVAVLRAGFGAWSAFTAALDFRVDFGERGRQVGGGGDTVGDESARPSA